jgi:hypothetical protein
LPRGLTLAPSTSYILDPFFSRSPSTDGVAVKDSRHQTDRLADTALTGKAKLEARAEGCQEIDRPTIYRWWIQTLQRALQIAPEVLSSSSTSVTSAASSIESATLYRASTEKSADPCCCAFLTSTAKNRFASACAGNILQCICKHENAIPPR